MGAAATDGRAGSDRGIKPEPGPGPGPRPGLGARPRPRPTRELRGDAEADGKAEADAYAFAYAYTFAYADGPPSASAICRMSSSWASTSAMVFARRCARVCVSSASACAGAEVCEWCSPQRGGMCIGAWAGGGAGCTARATSWAGEPDVGSMVVGVGGGFSLTSASISASVVCCCCCGGGGGGGGVGRESGGVPMTFDMRRKPARGWPCAVCLPGGGAEGPWLWPWRQAEGGRVDITGYVDADADEDEDRHDSWRDRE